MELFECAPEDDHLFFIKECVGSTCSGEEEAEGVAFNDPFMESSEIGSDAFALLYKPEQDSQQELPTPAPGSLLEFSPAPAEPQAVQTSVKRMKNSNAVKKMGRMILSRLEEYEVGGERNKGVAGMLSRLGTQAGRRRPDCFNTSHLEALFAPDSCAAFNLRTTRMIFSRELRAEVFASHQLKGDSRLVYLNTFKCCSLRFMARRLASRLQASEAPQ